jgi:hypothetical protein
MKLVEDIHDVYDEVLSPVMSSGRTEADKSVQQVVVNTAQSDRLNDEHLIHLSSIQCDFFLTCDSWGLAHSSYRISIAAATILLVGPYYSITLVWWSLRSHPNIELPSGAYTILP